ncbi:hypothetical protein CKY28_01865 [Sphingomonas lenta]|uniref:Uncharacterized protein n=1 Tax=Sphingomonas lenta TaxID=1141887 RepID=A0A2A2SJX4_9SPHN|nr:hypothetical protein CKY28_01865 [Sphingomonas lenta]
MPLDPLEPPDELELDDDEELDELELEDEPPMPPVLLVLDDPFELNPPVDDEYPLDEDEKPSLDEL